MVGFAGRFSEKPLYNLLTPETMTIREEDHDGLRHYILEARTDQGQVEIWVAPDQNYLMKKCILTKEADKDLSSEGTAPYNEICEFLDSHKTKSVTEITVKEVEYIDGKYIPVQIETEYHHEVEDGREWRFKNSCVISEVDTNPDFDALNAFEFSVPENTTTTLIRRDRSIIGGLQWENGQLIADMEEDKLDEKMREALASIEVTVSEKKAPAKLSFLINKLDLGAAAQMKEELWLYILTAAALILLISGWILYRYILKRKKSPEKE